MATTTIGQIQLIATIDTSQYKAGAKDIERTNGRIESSSDKTSNNINKGFNAIAKVGLAAVAAAAVAAGAAITSNLGNAIRRVDTLNNANRTFENMGFETRQVETSMERLIDSITGLPTPLDSAVRGMQSLSATYGNVEQGQRIFTALNNAILGFGGTAAEVDNAIQQLSQLPMDGPLDAQTWNSLRNSGLTPVLVAMAKDFGLSINEMKEDFGEGELTVRDFTEALTRMDKEGGGGLKSLEQVARDATSGIGTGWANMQTAITRGVANIIERIGSENISRAIAGIGEAFESGLTGVIKAIDLFEEYSGVIRDVAMTIGIFLIPALTRYIALQTVAGVQALIAGGRIAAGWLLALGPIGLIAAAVGAAAALIVSNWESIEPVVTSVFNTITSIWENITDFFSNLWNGIVKSVSDIWGNIVKVVKAIFDTVVGAVTGAFNAITAFISRWGLTILAIIFFPFSIVIGLIFRFREQIFAVFNAIRQFIIATFTPIINFFITLFTGIFNVISSVFNMIVGAVISAASVIINIIQSVGSFISSVFQAAWGAVQTAFNAAVGFFTTIWNGIVTIFSPIVGFFSGVFQSAWNAVKSVFSAVGGYFRGVWNTIVGIFGGVGTAVGNAIGSAFKSVINTVLRGAVNIINGFIDAINFAIDAINEIPGVTIGRLDKLNVPQLADGGVVSSATLAVIGEGSEPEAVIPLSRLDDMLSNSSSGDGNGREVVINQENNIYTEVDMRQINRDLTWELRRA